jgi:adenosine deaminase
VWTALDQLHADRLQHGVRSIEDPDLVETLIESQVGLDICPTSNICLDVYPDIGSHPVRRLWEAGVLVTINSDDPPMFNTDLNQEYRLLVDNFDFQVDELEQISLNGVRASLMPDDQKVALETEFESQFAQLREELA